ncbi:MAG: HNH endonuclease [Dehalococcoidia bacterium]
MLPLGRPRRYCPQRSHDEFLSCFRQYWRYFEWGSAARWCLQRYDYKCANCGSNRQLRVHHIIPLEGRPRLWTPYNQPWNLIALCHVCHMEVHEAMRPSKDIFDLARVRGQLVLNMDTAVYSNH